jgi:bifunctional UDP-N-acetylglucosamine pyrophosphorylase/glucosamine-1-phosphate N-acetyltransferase
MKNQQKTKIELLAEKGVEIPNPAAVEIGEEVDPERVSPKGVVIHPGCRISGETTLIMAGVHLGEEAPATVRDCQLGKGVELKGGFFRNSVFLEKANLGSGSQVRDACILEEEAGGAHSVGLKHTILFPFVTLGSLINFCDCLMAGGTSRKNHSEVGSSYIHFNYTPNQDKATPSLIGDVPRGVMLNQPPIFLGGQGGLAGPAVIGYGTVISAGTIYRKDCPEGAKVLFGPGTGQEEREFYPGLYWRIRRRVLNNINYIANLIALRQWYLQVRSLFSKPGFGGEELQRAALQKLELAIEERIKRLRALAEKMPASVKTYEAVMGEKAPREILFREKELSAKWPEIEELLENFREETGENAVRDVFLKEISRLRRERGGDYVTVIQSLAAEWSKQGTGWLQGIVDGIVRRALEILPSFKSR